MTRRRRTPAKSEAEVEVEVDHGPDFWAAVAAARAALRGDTSPPTMAEQIEQVLTEREASARRAAERARWEAAKCPGGGACVRCGLLVAEAVDEDGVVSSGWYVDADLGGFHCILCEVEQFAEMPFTAGEPERRETTARHLLGLTSIPMRAVAAPQLFADLPIWWCDHPDAPAVTSMEGRFAFIDLDRLRADYDSIANPIATTEHTYVRRDACSVCGRRDRWVETVQSLEQIDGTVRDFPTWVCMGCVTSRPWSVGQPV